MGAQTFVPHGTHINFDSLIFDLGAGPRVPKGVSLAEMHILGAQHASDPANPKKRLWANIMGMVCTYGCSDICAARHAHQL